MPSTAERLGTFVHSARILGAERFELRQIQVAGESKVFEWSASALEGIGDLVVAQMIEEQAASDCEVLRGTNRYFVVAFRADRGAYLCRQGFVVTSDSVRGGDDLQGSEPATQAGIIAHLLRHDEIQFRAVLLALESSRRTDDQQAERRDRYIDRMEKKHFSVLELLERLTSEESRREIRATKAKSEQAMKAELMSSLTPLVPALGARLLGVGAPMASGDGSPSTVGEQTLVKIFETLDDKQSEAMMKILTSTQQVAVLEYFEAKRLSEARQREEREAAAAKAAAAEAASKNGVGG